MSNCMFKSLTVFAVMFVLVGFSFAQSDRVTAALGDKYVISAKAGAVNFIEGSVTVVRPDGTSGSLIKGDTVGVGDKVSTGANAKAEVLLNPGSYLRLGGNSSFEFKTTELDDLKLFVEKGSAVLEVFASNDFEVKIDTPKAGFVIIQSGIYRVDILDGQGTLNVIKGRAEVAGLTDEQIKSGRRAVLTEGVASISKYKSGDPDGLEAWSKSRSKELTKISSSLEARTLRPTLMRSFLGNGWNMYNSFGLWVYDPFRGVNCFLPFGMGWGSPYGYYYGYGIWRFNLPPVIYAPPVIHPGTNPTPKGPRSIRPATPGVIANESAKGTRSIRPSRGSVSPPFRQMENDNKGSRVVRQPVFNSPTDMQSPRSPVGFPTRVDAPAPAPVETKGPRSQRGQ